jgi:hypothetical protein
MYYFSVAPVRGWMPYCSRTFVPTTAGLLNSKSVPTLVLGKAITSRIDCVLQRIVIKRSNPVDNHVNVTSVDYIERTESNSAMRWGTASQSV